MQVMEQATDVQKNWTPFHTFPKKPIDRNQLTCFEHDKVYKYRGAVYKISILLSSLPRWKLSSHEDIQTQVEKQSRFLSVKAWLLVEFLFERGDRN